MKTNVTGLSSPGGGGGAADGNGDTYVSISADFSITNTTSFTNVTNFSFSLDTHSKYAFQSYLVWSSDGTPDIRIKWIVPSGASIRWNTTDIFTTTKTQSNYHLGAGSGAATLKFNHFVANIDTGSTSGNLQLRIAQDMADASFTYIRNQSWLKYRKLD